MDWKYHIPHEWEADRTTWEDIWLKPSIHAVPGHSYWLTLDTAVDDERKYEGRFNNVAYLISGDNIYINAKDFSKEDLLEFARFWLMEQGFGEVCLVEGCYEEFRGSNQHFEMLEGARSALKEIQEETGDDDT